MNVWGDDKVKELDRYQVGDRVKVSFNLSSREYNGRWYTDIRAWRIEPLNAAPAEIPVSMPSVDDMPPPLSDDDLPF